MGNGFSEPSIKRVKQVEIKPEWHEENRLALKQLIIKCLDVLNTDNQITLYINNHIYREGHRVVGWGALDRKSAISASEGKQKSAAP